ncbi:hypothetical protein POVWA2_027230 [Plasmodium ovale wallikeri]|uniref:Uncharacterized protein n=1 Tax=Plasmodium ovale wallikeri TaxID=864142 RepID=A0A1A8YW52_PLAOA|nr:hypothetical protein POVWA1_029230 [Plasmodium ovale wallikeri]SBT35899.1 hypothetical protein POVWA2_027230 [Plasmodium ovale wallikeri]
MFAILAIFLSRTTFRELPFKKKKKKKKKPKGNKGRDVGSRKQERRGACRCGQQFKSTCEEIRKCKMGSNSKRQCAHQNGRKNKHENKENWENYANYANWAN